MGGKARGRYRCDVHFVITLRRYHIVAETLRSVWCRDLVTGAAGRNVSEFKRALRVSVLLESQEISNS